VILVGTAGWADRDLIASGWYPSRANTPAGRLAHYAERFSLVEVDSTYYAIPAQRTVRGWADNAAGPLMDVKAYSLFTGQRTRSATLPEQLRDLTRSQWVTTETASPALLDAAWQCFHDTVEPLNRAGRLGLVLLQFPATYRCDARGQRLVAEALERCRPLRAAVEWRHPSWFEPAHREHSLQLLRDHEAAFVCVDMPQSHRDAVPPLLTTTANVAVVRLHGHSTAWSGGGKEERYRYEYTDAELAGWAAKAHQLAEHAEEVHVVVNTCCAGAAQRAGSKLLELI
jgi:uncharacterized protein YecE (DUF72 family)